ncbi:hypothetical protein [Corynebacterium frankenforstense]
MSGERKRRQHVRVRFTHVVFLAIAVVCTIALAWWQWTRFQSGSGTFQNLGYAFQWPMFGAFFVYAYRKFLQYENEKIDADNAVLDAAEHGDADTDGADTDAAGTVASSDPEMDRLYAADAAEFDDTASEEVAQFLPERPNLDVEDFNRLNRRRRGGEDLSGLADLAGD